MTYDRATLIEVLSTHQRVTVAHCQCGWIGRGRIHSEHVADTYEALDRYTHAEITRRAGYPSVTDEP